MEYILQLLNGLQIVLEHCWYMSEARQGDVTTEEAIEDYVRNVLPQHWDEESYLYFPDIFHFQYTDTCLNSKI